MEEMTAWRGDYIERGQQRALALDFDLMMSDVRLKRH